MPITAVARCVSESKYVYANSVSPCDGQLCAYTGKLGTVLYMSGNADCGGQSGDPVVLPARAAGEHICPWASVKPHVAALVSAWLIVYCPQGGCVAPGVHSARNSAFPNTGVALVLPLKRTAAAAALKHVRATACARRVRIASRNVTSRAICERRARPSEQARLKVCVQKDL